MKNIYFLLLLLAFLLPSCSEDNNLVSDSSYVIANVEESINQNTDTYFVYHGNIIKLYPSSRDQYVALSSTSFKHIKSTKAISTRSKSFKQINIAPLCTLTKGIKEQSTDMWGIVDNVDKEEITNALNAKDNSFYTSPVYYNERGDKVVISHLFYVKLKELKDESILQNIAAKHNVEVLGKDKYLPNWYTLSCSNESKGIVLDIINSFQKTQLFECVEPDIMVPLQQVNKVFAQKPNDTYFSKQWNINGTNSINLNYNLIQEYGKGVTLGLIDQGIEGNHPDLNLPNGLISFDLVIGTHDYINNIYGPHGTACAGIIAAKTNNSKGIAGIAPNVKLISYCHPLQESPNAIQQLANGLSQAAESCDVLSCSWGGNALVSSLIEDALKYYAFNWGRKGKGTVVVFSTGNDNTNVNFPANCNEKILTVGSINSSGKRSSFSNYGNALDVVAPGEAIPTLDLLGKDGYSSSEYCFDFQGTSASCPHVAAVAALVLSANPNLKGVEVNEIIEKTAKKLKGYSFSQSKENGSWNNEVGYGLIDAEAAVAEALKRK